MENAKYKNNARLPTERSIILSYWQSKIKKYILKNDSRIS